MVELRVAATESAVDRAIQIVVDGLAPLIITAIARVAAIAYVVAQAVVHPGAASIRTTAGTAAAIATR